MKRFLKFLCSISLCFIFSGISNATLWDRGGGLIYDDFLNITWLQDANYGSGSIYDDNIYNGTITDGKMTWDNAVAWVDQLDYQGYDDWRLPTTPGITYGLTSEGEMGHMYYSNLGGSGSLPGGDFTDGNGDTVSFLNLKSGFYWLDRVYSSNPSYAWNYALMSGSQYYMTKVYDNYAWAVRPGDSSPIPIPGAVWLLGSGLIGIVGSGRKFKK